MANSSPLFNRTVSVAGKTYPESVPDIADMPTRLTEEEKDVAALEAGLRNYIRIGSISTKASDAAVLRMPGGMAGTLLKVKTILNGALATGNATLTAAINSTGVTGGVVTMTQSASAAGDVASATCTALNTFAENDKITFTIGGTSTATATAEVYALIKYTA